jgi:hypothetical protein
VACGRYKHQLTLAGVTAQADDALERLRRNIPARTEVGQGWAVNSEVLGNALLIGTTNTESRPGGALQGLQALRSDHS